VANYLQVKWNQKKPELSKGQCGPESSTVSSVSKPEEQLVALSEAQRQEAIEAVSDYERAIENAIEYISSLDKKKIFAHPVLKKI
jgi:hypothetical protein